MKRILIVAIMLVAGAAAHCQAVYQYPYSGYMEIPIPPLGACQVGRYPGRVSPYIVWKRASPIAILRPFLVDTPTVIYGIAILLWGQDTAKRDLSAQLYTINKHLERMTLMTLQRDVRIVALRQTMLSMELVMQILFLMLNIQWRPFLQIF